MATRKTAAEKAAETEAPMAIIEGEVPESAPAATTVVVQEKRSTQELLPMNADQPSWTPQQAAIMQQLSITAAPIGFIESFLDQCRRTGLDPLARQIYGIQLGGKWTTLISIDGFRVISERSGKYRGMTPTMWCGPDGIWRDVWLDTAKPAAARVGILHADFDQPLYAIATWEGYGKNNGQWVKNGPNMLAKCAEALARRQAFPQDLSGLYSTEEMDQARGNDTAPAAAAAPARRPAQADVAPPAPAAREIEMRAPKIDWLAELAEVRDMEGLKALFEKAQAAGDLYVGVKNPLNIPGQPEFIPLGEYLKRERSRFTLTTAAAEGEQPVDRLAQAQAGINHQQEAPAE